MLVAFGGDGEAMMGFVGPLDGGADDAGYAVRPNVGAAGRALVLVRVPVLVRVTRRPCAKIPFRAA